MRKLFTDRARLVVYVEATDLERLTAKARSEGRTVVEWARETLLEELGGDSAVRPKRAVSIARRGAAAAGPYDAEGRLGEGSAPVVKLCRHNLSSCTVCGG